MTGGLKYQLESVSWDWFCTFTFGMRKEAIDQTQGDLLEKTAKFRIVGTRVPNVSVRFSMFYKWLRQQEDHWKQKKTMWVLRHERGEVGERPHFHCLIRGLPVGADIRPFRFAAMHRWEQLGGGMARIRSFDGLELMQSASFVGYTLKNLGANAYEIAKFELDGTDVRLSPALLEYLAERSNLRTV